MNLDVRPETHVARAAVVNTASIRNKFECSGTALSADSSAADCAEWLRDLRLTGSDALRGPAHDSAYTLWRLCHSNPTVEPLGTRHSGRISSSERVWCTRVLRPPRAAPLQNVAGMYLKTARVCFLDVRACFDDAQLDDVPDLRRFRFALPPSMACCEYASPAPRAAQVHSQYAFSGWGHLKSGAACDFADAARARGVLRQ